MTAMRACIVILTLIVVMIFFLFGLLYYSDNSTFNNTWVQAAVERTFDIIKILCGALAGVASSSVISKEAKSS